jgi:hypothetical protein
MKEHFDKTLREARKLIRLNKQTNEDVIRMRQSRPEDEDDESPQKIRMIPPRRTKFSSLKWSPIFNMLSKLCKDEAKWDDAWSDICKEINSATSVGNEVRQIIKSLVVSDVTVKDGIPFHPNGKQIAPSRYYRREQYYVDPETGILKSVPEYSAKKEEKEKSTFFIENGETLFAKDVDGVWYSFSWKHWKEVMPLAFSAVNFQWEVSDKEIHRVLGAKFPEGFSERAHVIPIFDEKFLERFKDPFYRSEVPHFPRQFLKLGKANYIIYLKQLSKKEKKEVQEYINIIS